MSSLCQPLAPPLLPPLQAAPPPTPMLSSPPQQPAPPQQLAEQSAKQSMSNSLPLASMPQDDLLADLKAILPEVPTDFLSTNSAAVIIRGRNERSGGYKCKACKQPKKGHTCSALVANQLQLAASTTPSSVSTGSFMQAGNNPMMSDTAASNLSATSDAAPAASSLQNHSDPLPPLSIALSLPEDVPEDVDQIDPMSFLSA